MQIKAVTGCCLIYVGSGQLKGLRPHKRWQSKYNWSYCYGTLDPIEGKSVFLQIPSMNLEWTKAFLQEIQTQYPDYEHIVVWDGARAFTPNALAMKLSQREYTS